MRIEVRVSKRAFCCFSVSWYGCWDDRTQIAGKIMGLVIWRLGICTWMGVFSDEGL